MDGAVEGMKAMLPANIILVLAWTISGVCRDLLQTPIFVESLVADGGVSGAFLPAIVFLIAGFLSFSTGTAWGTFGILIPIIVPVAQAVDPDLVVVSLSATLAGSVFGDHCSPISDTTTLYRTRLDTAGLCVHRGFLLLRRLRCRRIYQGQSVVEPWLFPCPAAHQCVHFAHAGQ